MCDTIRQWNEAAEAYAVGVDGACAMTDIGKKNYPDCAFLTAGITKPLPFGSEFFDLFFFTRC